MKPLLIAVVGACVACAAGLDQMFVISTAVNRISRGGVVIGPDQRITPMEALKAITINSATSTASKFQGLN
jgi:predicted amidohydrolase YtcJ